MKVIALMLVMINVSVKADEGMWLLPLLKQLNEGEMHELGAKLSAEDIYDLNDGSLKDAVMIFGGGCTGEFISSEGLVLTNHHCGYGTIQQHSTVEHDYLKDGFWAKDKKDEIASPGLSVKLLQRIEDVTDQVLVNVVDSMSEMVRADSIDAAISRMMDAADSTVIVSIKPFFEGNAFYRFEYLEYTDVRFVGAPPSAIGKFGADTDNWMWPRHTADFSLFRVYADADGNPAEYSEDNVPFTPKRHLKVSMKGVQNKDFAMMMGFPGSTNRYLTSWGIDQRMRLFNQTLIDVRGVKQDVWLTDMQKDPAVKIKYASKYARSSNYYKNSIGMNRQLKRLDVLDKKRALEADFQQWAEADNDRIAEYGDALPTVEAAYASREETYSTFVYLREALYTGIELPYFALRANALRAALESKDDAAIANEIESLRESAKAFYKDYNPSTDQKTMVALTALYAQRMSAANLPSFYDEVKDGDYESYAQSVFKKSIFASEERFNAFLDKPRANKLKKDPAVMMGMSIRKAYYAAYDNIEQLNYEIGYGNRLFVKGLQLMLKDKSFYPDANFTMRLTYGTVGDYSPRDAVHYNYFTTLAGVMEKEDPDNWEFVVPSKLKELYETQDYGQYADADSTMHVCFITNNDITGGNSGSPVINADGDLFGLAFDSNWEGMSGDIAFEPYLQRVVNVDIRYVLFIIDKFAGAGYLVDEMDLVW